MVKQGNCWQTHTHIHIFSYIFLKFHFCVLYCLKVRLKGRETIIITMAQESIAFALNWKRWNSNIKRRREEEKNIKNQQQNCTIEKWSLIRFFYSIVFRSARRLPIRYHLYTSMYIYFEIYTYRQFILFLMKIYIYMLCVYITIWINKKKLLVRTLFVLWMNNHRTVELDVY